MSRFSCDYPIARATGRCAGTGQILPPGSTCMATLVEHGPDGGLVRLDYSMEAWESGESGGRPEGLFSYWKTIVPEADERRRLLVDDEVLEPVRAAGRRRPAAASRVPVRAGPDPHAKRLLKYVGRSGEGEDEQWLMASREGPPIPVRNPRLSDDDVRELTGQLSEILQTDL